MTTPQLTLSFSDDPIVAEQRKRAFEKLQTVVTALAEYEGMDAVRLIPDLDHQTFSDDSIHINSLVFQLESNDNKPILVVLNSNDKVDTNKLKDIMNSSSCRLAENVELLCGFPPGSVPPMAHSPNSLYTIIDERLLLKQNGAAVTLLGGGGHPNVACQMRLDVLLMMEGVHVADIAVDKQEQLVLPESAPQIPFCRSFFPYSPPATTDSTPLIPIPVTLVGRITCVRRMAARLCFLDLAPPDYRGTNNASKDQYDLPWKSPLDGTHMAVQVIAGKTLCKLLGDEESPAALKRFKPGQLLLVQGKTNVGNQDSLDNWNNKRSFDIVMFNFTILEEKLEISQTIPTIKVERQLLSSTESKKRSIKRTSDTPVGSSAQNQLKLDDIFQNTDAILMVDNMVTVDEFAFSLQNAIASLPTHHVNGDDEHSVAGLKNIGMVGVDCEWKPSFLMSSPSEPRPVLLLQISLQPIQKVFLLDLQLLLRPLLSPSEEMNQLETAVCNAFTILFQSNKLLKIGFQVKADLRLLAASYPHISAFREVHSVVEVSLIARKAMQLARIRDSRQLVVSLATLTEFLTKKRMSKEQQVSDWSQRPLTPEQIEYSGLDAAISPFLFEKSMKLANASWFPSTSEIGRWANDIAFTKSILSVRFMLLHTEDPMVIRKLKAKRVIGEPYVVTQSWETGTKGPELPSVPSNEGYGPYRDVHGILRVPVGLISIGENKLQLNSMVGQRVGKSKDKCMEKLVKGNPDVPVGATLDFPQRAGHVEFRDGIVLFVNMPNKVGVGKLRGYPNEWIDGGKTLTWFTREHEWNGGTSELAVKLTGTPEENQEPLVLLFVRMGKDEFLFCGPCKLSTTPEANETEPEVSDWGLVTLNLELLAFEQLKGLKDFSSMVHAQEMDSGDDDTVDDVFDNEKTTSNMETERTLLRLVENGDLITAVYLATKHCKDEPRSLAFGLDTLRTILLQSTLEVNEAIRSIDNAAGLIKVEL